MKLEQDRRSSLLATSERPHLHPEEKLPVIMFETQQIHSTWRLSHLFIWKPSIEADIEGHQSLKTKSCQVAYTINTTFNSKYVTEETEPTRFPSWHLHATPLENKRSIEFVQGVYYLFKAGLLWKNYLVLLFHWSRRTWSAEVIQILILHEILISLDLKNMASLLSECKPL
jgi:hypothetical protein